MNAIKELFDQRRRMRAWLQRDDIHEDGKNWLRTELENDVRYIRQEVAEAMRRERRANNSNREDKGYANPDDRIEHMGDFFVKMNLGQRHGVTFEQYVHLVEIGEWNRVAGVER